MTVRYFDSVNGNDSNNGLTPATAWASYDNKSTSCGPGDTLLFARDTVQNINTIYRQVSNGTSTSNVTYVGAYGTGANPIFRNPASLGNMILNSSNAKFVTYEDLDFDCTVTSGTGVSPLYISTQTSGTCNDLIFRRCIFRNSSYGSGFNVNQELAATNAPNNILLEDCLSYNNFAHGYIFTGYNITVNRCYSYGNGWGTGAHGFSSYRIRETHTSGWSFVSGNTYSKVISKANVYYVRLTAGAQQGTYPILFKNTTTPTTPGAGEFGYSGSTIYVNLGADPNTHTLSVSFGVGGYGINYKDCVAFSNQAYALYPYHEGHGFAFDDFTSFSSMDRCISTGNQGAGVSINQGEYVTITNCVFANNDYYGISASGMPNHTICNNLLYGNGKGLPAGTYAEMLIQSFMSSLTVKNNIIRAKGGIDKGIWLSTLTATNNDISNNMVYGDYSESNVFSGTGTPLTTSKNLFQYSVFIGTTGSAAFPTGWVNVGSNPTSVTLMAATTVNGVSTEYVQHRRIAGNGTFEGFSQTVNGLATGINYAFALWVRCPTGVACPDLKLYTGSGVPNTVTIATAAQLSTYKKDVWVRVGTNVTFSTLPSLMGIGTTGPSAGAGVDIALPQMWQGLCFMDLFGVDSVNTYSVNPQVNQNTLTLEDFSTVKGLGASVGITLDAKKQVYSNPPSIGPWEHRGR